LQAIGEAVKRARSGSGAVLFVIGEAGLGKSSVLQTAREVAGDIDVTFAAAEEMERSLPFGVIDQALAGLGAGLVGPADGAVVEPSAPYHRALRALQARRERSALIVVDDLHYADEDSLRLLSFLARRLESLPIALIGALRPWPIEPHELCRALAQDGVAKLEWLRPLSREAAETLLTSRAAGRVAPEAAVRGWELCGGNPLLLEHVAAGLARGEELPELPDHARDLGRGILLSRFAGIGRDGLALARAASVLGTRFRAGLPGALAELDDPGLDEALVRSGVLTDAGSGEVRFTHPLFAQALYDDLGPAGRRRLHARAFAILADLALDAEAGEHAIRADLVGDDRAVAVLSRAGRRALRAGAVASAATQLRAAVKLSGERPAAELLYDLCEALMANGRVDDAIAIGREPLADQALDWRARLGLLRIRGRGLYLLGSADHGDGAFAEAIDIAIEHGAPELAVPALMDQSLSAWLAGGPSRALPVAARARQLARAARNAQLQLQADAAWGHLANEAGDAAGLEYTTAIERRMADGTMSFDASELAWPWASVYHAAMGANYSERFGDAEGIFKRARSVMEAAGAPYALATLAIYIANNVLRQGRIAEALEEAERAREFSELTPGVLPYADLMRAEVLAWAGRLDESEPLCDAAEAAAAGHWFVQVWAAHVRGMVALWRGADGASEQFLVAERVTDSVGIREPCHVQWQRHAIAAHLAAGRTDDARRMIHWLEERAAGLPCRWPRIAAMLGNAQLAAAAGRSDDAETGFQLTLRLHTETELPLQRIEALVAYGSFLRRNGRPADARHQLANALEVAETTGAGWLERTARSELALSGGRRRRAPISHDQLTAAEERVAQLAAHGDSNADIARQLFVSINTVETHLKRVYAKLGIHSRRELMKNRRP
jgi:DNA-binding CsgD family transcriptional regulator